MNGVGELHSTTLEVTMDSFFSGVQLHFTIDQFERVIYIMENFIAHLKEVIPEKDSLKLVKKEAENYYKQHSLDECFATGLELYQSENFQIQEVGVFLVGYAACKNTSALSFLKDTVSQHKSWK